MKATGAPLAGEMSGHIFFKHQWYGFDDALYAAIRTIRAVSASGKTLTELKIEMPLSVATPELRFQVDETRKFAAVREVAERLAAEGANVNATDGVRVSTPDGWWLLRASNTQDVLVARAEAKDQAGLDRLMATVNEQLEKSGIAAVEAAH
jgi:phosphomannomutase